MLITPTKREWSKTKALHQKTNSISALMGEEGVQLSEIRRLDEALKDYEVCRARSEIGRKTDLKEYIKHIEALALLVKSRDLGRSLIRGVIGLQKASEAMLSNQNFFGVPKRPTEKRTNSTQTIMVLYDPNSDKQSNEIVSAIEKFKSMQKRMDDMKNHKINHQLKMVLNSLYDMYTDVPEPTHLPNAELYDYDSSSELQENIHMSKRHSVRINNDKSSQTTDEASSSVTGSVFIDNLMKQKELAIAELNSQIKIITSEKEMSEDINDRYKTEMIGMQEEIEKVKSLNTKLQRRITEVENSYTHLSNEDKLLRKTLESCKENLDKIQAENKGLVADLDKKNELFQKLEHENQRMVIKKIIYKDKLRQIEEQWLIEKQSPFQYSKITEEEIIKYMRRKPQSYLERVERSSQETIINFSKTEDVHHQSENKQEENKRVMKNKFYGRTGLKSKVSESEAKGIEKERKIQNIKEFVPNLNKQFPYKEAPSKTEIIDSFNKKPEFLKKSSGFSSIPGQSTELKDQFEDSTFDYREDNTFVNAEAPNITTEDNRKLFREKLGNVKEKVGIKTGDQKAVEYPAQKKKPSPIVSERSNKIEKEPKKPNRITRKTVSSDTQEPSKSRHSTPKKNERIIIKKQKNNSINSKASSNKKEQTVNELKMPEDPSDMLKSIDDQIQSLESKLGKAMSSEHNKIYFDINSLKSKRNIYEAIANALYLSKSTQTEKSIAQVPTRSWAKLEGDTYLHSPSKSVIHKPLVINSSSSMFLSPTNDETPSLLVKVFKNEEIERLPLDCRYELLNAMRGHDNSCSGSTCIHLQKALSIKYRMKGVPYPIHYKNIQ